MISAVEVRVNGTPLDPELAAKLLEVRVEDHLRLPDAFLIRISDPGLEHVDSNPLEVGAEIEIKFAGIDSSDRLVTLLKGQITSLEPEFSGGGAILAARGYDHSHSLNRSRTNETYQNATAADIAQKVARRAGLQTGTIDSDPGGPQDFVQQHGETDWDFLTRLAGAIDFEVTVQDKKLHFKKAAAPNGSPITLRWGDELHVFKPRVTGVQQVNEVVVRGWDPQTKQAIEATASQSPLSSTIGIARSALVSALGGGSHRVGHRPVTTANEADALAKSLLAQLGNAYVEAHGTTKGDPRLRAGGSVKIDGIGQRFGGTYTLSSTVHVYRSTKGYETLLAITGRAPRSLVDLMTPSRGRNGSGSTTGFASTVAVGVVTNNEDPDGMGRVRVKYPTLDDQTEGWWARVASPSAGKDRGLLMMPIVGDEVLVAFEHGDLRRPYVIGSLWNGKDTPGDLMQKDGSFALQSDKNVAIKAKEKITITATGDVSLEGKAAWKQKLDGDTTLEAKSISVKAQSSLTIESQSSVTIKAPQVSIEASGVAKVSGSQVMLG
jgi:phage protein D